MKWSSLVLASIILPCMYRTGGVFGGSGIHAAAAPTVVMNELMASNNAAVKDPQGHYEDWVELHNPGPAPVDIGGLYLTDDPADPIMWQIPLGRSAQTTIPAGGYLLIWLDGHTTDAGLHASFRLGAAGDRIALFDADGRTLIDSVEFGEQAPNISYGRDPAQPDEWRYFALPTPGMPNVGAFRGRIADLKFSHKRGFYSALFLVTITTQTPDVEVFYTTDGSSPFDLKQNAPTGRPYTGPIPIATTTCLRAVGYKLGWVPTKVETHTYLFLDDVIRQATDPQTRAQVTPNGYPTSWGGVTGDYQMDPDVVGQNGTDIFNGLYANTIRDDLKAAPTISLVMPKDDWFGSKGIYINKSQDGTERVASFEYIDPATGETVQANCAIAMQGGVTGGGTSLNRWKTFKLSMRPRFKTRTDDGTPTGGPSEVDFRIFPDSPVRRLNTIVLDGVLNHSWLHQGADQQISAMYVQDQYVSDLHNALGGYSGHGSYAHVYIDGLYWGLYYIHERPDHKWAAEVFGGDESEYDAVKHSGGGVINSGAGGSASTNYNAMVSAANAVASDPDDMAKYQALCDLLDVDNFIAYVLANWFTGNHDWPQKNWYATHRNTPDGRWRFHSWDAEHVTEGTDSVGQSPSDLHRKLSGNAEYRMKFADAIHRAFFHGGPLTYPAAAGLYQARMDQIDRAIVGESARWGDNRRSLPYTRLDWLNVQNAKLAGFFPGRSNQVFSALKSAGLYSSIAAPEFQINGVAQHGGHTTARPSFSITGDAGDIWYTLDGTDPRVPGAAPEPADAVILAAENAIKQVLVPTGPISDAWRTDPAFAAAGWQVGFGGVGFEASKGYEDYFDIDVQSTMYQKNATCYIRVPFMVTAAMQEGLATLTLKVRYDDGFVAWLNGAEVQRVALNGTPAWNSSASASHSDVDAVDFVSFDLSSRIADLGVGANLLAIQGLNQGANSSDFLISVELVGDKGAVGSVTPSGVSPTARRYTGPITLGQSILVKARALSGGTWSALDEAVYAVGPVAESLRISEIMYHPLEMADAEYIELTNIGPDPINLKFVRFTEGIAYTFPDYALASGGYCLLVKDIVAFGAAYAGQTLDLGVNPVETSPDAWVKNPPYGLPIVGQYAGSLNNGGERIELVDAVGGVIQSFKYKDGWYDQTDGMGFSLTLLDPQADGNDPEDWRPALPSPGQ